MTEQWRAASRNAVGLGKSSRGDLRLASATSRPTNAAPDDGPHVESLGRLARLPRRACAVRRGVHTPRARSPRGPTVQALP